MVSTPLDNAAFSNQLPPGHNQAPLSGVNPAVSTATPHPRQDFLQSYQARQPYLSYHNQFGIQGRQNWLYQQQQRINATIPSAISDIGQVMTSINRNRVILPASPLREEDLISFEDQSPKFSNTQLALQRAWLLSQQPNAPTAPVPMINQLNSSYQNSPHVERNPSLGMDHTIHQAQQQRPLQAQQHGYNGVPQRPKFEMHPAGSNLNPFQQPNLRYVGGAQPFIPLALNTVQGIVDHRGLFNTNNQAFQHYRFGQRNALNSRAQLAVRTPKTRLTTMLPQTNNAQTKLAQNNNRQTNVLQSTTFHGMPQKANQQKTLSQCAVPATLPKKELNARGGQPVAARDGSTPKLQTGAGITEMPRQMVDSTPKIAASVPVVKAPATETAISRSTFPSGGQQQSRRAGRKTRRGSRKNKPIVPEPQSVPTHDNPPADISKPSGGNTAQSVTAQAPEAKRVVRTAIFNVGVGEKMQGAANKVVRDNTPNKTEHKRQSTLDASSTEEETISNGSSPSRQNTMRRSIITKGKGANHPEKRLPSFEELFGSSDATSEGSQRFLVARVPGADKNRPPTLDELMQERNCSKSSLSTMTGSPNVSKRAIQRQSSENPQPPTEQITSKHTTPTGDSVKLTATERSDIPFGKASVHARQQVSLLDDDIAGNAFDAHPVIGLHSAAHCSTSNQLQVKGPSSPDAGVKKVEFNLGSASSISESNDAESYSGSDSAATTATTRADALPIQLVSRAPPAAQVSTDSSSTSTQSTSPDPTPAPVQAKVVVDPFPCRYCPDEYRSAESRDRHQTICRRKGGWPKNCCFCGTILIDRNALRSHAPTCINAPRDALRPTPLDRFTSSTTTTTTTTTIPAAPRRHILRRSQPAAPVNAPPPVVSASAARNRRRRRAAVFQMANNNNRSPASIPRNVVPLPRPSTAVPRGLVNAAAPAPASTSTSAPNRNPRTRVGNDNSILLSRRQRRAGADRT